MNNKIAYKIIRDLADGIIPLRYRSSVILWLLSDKDADEKDSAFQNIWEQTEGDDSEIEDSLMTFHERRDTYEARRNRLRVVRLVLRYAAIFILPIVVALFTWLYAADHYSNAGEMVEYCVPDGQTGHIKLSDGTVITANGGTYFLYPREFRTDKGIRNVYLQGEAHFAVTHDSERPFIVNIGKLKVKVLGTHFNVKAYTNDKNIVTTLEEGKVKVYDSHSEATLLPGEQATYDRQNGQIVKNNVDTEKYNCWIKGNLNFEQQTLEEILFTLEHKYNVRFRISPSVDLSRRYTMNFCPQETVTDVMDVISELSKDLKYSRQGKVIKLYKIERRKYD